MLLKVHREKDLARASGPCACDANEGADARLFPHVTVGYPGYATGQYFLSALQREKERLRETGR